MLEDTVLSLDHRVIAWELIMVRIAAKGLHFSLAENTIRCFTLYEVAHEVWRMITPRV